MDIKFCIQELSGISGLPSNRGYTCVSLKLWNQFYVIANILQKVEKKIFKKSVVERVRNKTHFSAPAAAPQVHYLSGAVCRVFECLWGFFFPFSLSETQLFLVLCGWGVKFNKKWFLTRGYLLICHVWNKHYVPRAKTVEFPRVLSHIGKYRNHRLSIFAH